MTTPAFDPSKGWFSAQELAGLPGMPGDVSNTHKKAKKNLWANRRKLRGKGVEYALTSLPEETQRHLVGLMMDQAAKAEPATLPVPAPDAEALPVQAPGAVVKARGLTRKAKADEACTDEDRAYRDAALILCRALDAAMGETGCSARRACQQLAARLVAGVARPELIEAAETTYRRRRQGTATLGGLEATVTRLQRLLPLYEQGRLAGDVGLYLTPGKREKDGHNPAHVAAFLRFYCNPARPPVKEVLKKMAPWLEAHGVEVPSYTVALRIERSLPVTVKYRGRVTGSEWRGLKPYVERDVSMFHSNDIWVGDGHSFKAKVQHPIHGRPFVPEITVILDWVSRKIVGWSVALAESTVAVSDAFRHAQQTTRARPLVYYSDNGSGQTGKDIDCPVSGTLARQGIAHETGIPGNPQARGIIERLWQATFIPLAREYPTCTWRGADENATTKMLKLLNRKDLGDIKVPTFRQFLDDVERVVNDYNLHHEHRELDDNTPEDEYQARLDRGSIVFGPTDAELRALWMPEVIRTPQRGRVSLFGNEYCKGDLVDLLPEGAKVRVRYDLHDASKVILMTMDGRYLGEASWKSHKEAAFPVPMMDRLRAERAARKVKRGEAIIEEAQAELGEVIDLAPLMPAAPVDLLNMVSDADIAEMEAAKPSGPTTGDYMDMAMWLAEEEIDKAQDQEGSAEESADRRNAAG